MLSCSMALQKAFVECYCQEKETSGLLEFTLAVKKVGKEIIVIHTTATHDRLTSCEHVKTKRMSNKVYREVTVTKRQQKLSYFMEDIKN